MGSELTIDTGEQTGAKAERFVLSRGVLSAVFQDQSRANAPSPEPHAPCAPPKTRRFLVVRWLSPLGVRCAPICLPTNRENLPYRSSNRFVSIPRHWVPIALASSAAQIPAGCLPCLAPDRVRLTSGLLAAIAAAISVAGRPNNCSIERSPVLFS